MKHKIIFTIIAFFAIKNSTQAQIITAEDSLSAGLVASNKQTVISGYGEARYSYDLTEKNAEATLERVVLFVGHKFNNKISLFTEMEIEDAVVSKEDDLKVGEISMEQAVLKFDLNKSTYVLAGLFVPRVGIINENHLPTTFNGVKRPFVEKYVIPSTWRSLGVALYGEFANVRGLHYSLSLSKGLNGANFENGSGIREGRQLGNDSHGLSLATNASLLYYYKNFRIQYSTYIGGSSAYSVQEADSFKMKRGAFSNPVFLNECNVQYRNNGIEAKILGALIKIPNAEKMNASFGNNTPNALLGFYGEIGYNILHKTTTKHRSLVPFVRVEYMNLNQKVPSNGMAFNENKNTYFLGGLTYKPINGVALKLDYTMQKTGINNSSLYSKNNSINIGIAYNF